jgi:hemerythrin-like domain-containing protein
MPLGIPKAMEEEHEEIHAELAKATKMRGKVGEAAKKVAEVLHPHFEKENEIALPVIGIARELAEGGTSPDFPKALELHDRFKAEYEKMLQEHVEIVKTLDLLQKVAKTHKRKNVLEFVRKLKNHAKTEEDLTYPAVLMVGRLLKPT